VLCICSIAAVLLAEVVHHYFPKYVELHNYSAANSVRQKLYNWSTLNREWAAQPGRSQGTSPLGT
jgi:type VI protein secretion system component VasA